MKTFVSSRAGDIRANAEWLSSVEKALRKADKYVTLLTPNSVQRPWVNFEAGAAWYSEKIHILVRAGLEPEEIPLPLSKNQIYSLEIESNVRAIFDVLLDNKPTNMHGISAEVLSLISKIKLSGMTEYCWEGVTYQDVFYAWAGPLLSLDDKNAVPGPQQLLDLFKQRGMKCIWVQEKNLSHYIGRGLSQVFATDRKSWRRPVISKLGILMVRSELLK